MRGATHLLFPYTFMVWIGVYFPLPFAITLISLFFVLTNILLVPVVHRVNG
jgi:hypothetical protein